LTGPQLAAVDGVAELVGELPVQRAIACRVERHRQLKLGEWSHHPGTSIAKWSS
jgi:hypothetical protein